MAGNVISQLDLQHAIVATILTAVIAKDLTLPTPYGVLKKQGIRPTNPIVQIDDLDMVNVIQLQENYGQSLLHYLPKLSGDYDL